MQPPWIPSPECLDRLHADHARSFEGNLYVYPVLSRRARGISVGLNLNPDKLCNFDCVYCQVDRAEPGRASALEPGVLLQELEAMLELVASGEIYRDDRFASVPVPLRRLNDIAFSGDGEPTAAPEFGRVVRDVASLKQRRGLAKVKLILLTNATLLHRPQVRAALEVLDANHGEIWAKLDAGTEAYYRTIDRSNVRFERILANLREAARRWPIVVQSLFLSLQGRGPSASEIDAYVGRLEELIAGGGKVKLVQVYTVARKPADARVAPLDGLELERIGAAVRARLDVQVDVFQGNAHDASGLRSQGPPL
jgi:wyosine [tRNA(Phe)-imidazoG37] synthetase (radical SAM superfamily)